MITFFVLENADVGLLPMMWDENDPRPAREQAADNYAHGGGWRPFKGFTLSADHRTLTYPNDPPMHALAVAQLRDETIIVFDYAWVAIVQPDGTFEVSRMD